VDFNYVVIKKEANKQIPGGNGPALKFQYLQIKRFHLA